MYGNTDQFYSMPAVLGVQPPLPRPAAGARRAPVPTPPIANITDSGRLRLLCDVLDGGELCEVSKVGESNVDGLACTRSGKSMVIDYLLVGSVGGCSVSTIPRAVVTREESQLAADPVHGVAYAVLKWGSDHLPVSFRAVL